MNSEYLSIENAKKLKEYDDLLEKYNKLLGKYNEEHANNLNYKRMLTEREKNYLKSNKLKDEEIRKLKEKLANFEDQQMDIFEVEK